VLISCASEKRLSWARAEDMYISPLFVKNLEYAKKILKPDAIHILSGKYGLLDLEDEIDPDNETLNGKSTEERIEWATKIIQNLDAKYDIKTDKFIFLAYEKYYEHLIGYLKDVVIPQANLPIGARIRWLKSELLKASVDK
jgi:hypothetical protein